MNDVTANQQGSVLIKHNGPYRELSTSPYDKLTNIPQKAGMLQVFIPFPLGRDVNEFAIKWNERLP